MVPLRYTARSVVVRWKTTLLTAGGFTLVVATLVLTLAFVNGLVHTCESAADPRNVLVFQRGTSDELLSRIDAATALRVEASSGVSRDASGRAVASRELFMVLNQNDPETGQYRTLQVRGVSGAVGTVHSRFRLIEGRMHVPGRAEMIVGSGVDPAAVPLGGMVRTVRKDWVVVGRFEAGGALFESELWADRDELATLARQPGMCSSLVLRTDSPQAAETLADKLTNDQSLPVTAETESVYYGRQAEQMAEIRSIGLLIAAALALGAVSGVMNTMFASVSQRRKDIAVLRIIGFTKLDILLAFLAEAALMGTVGGVLGVLLASTFNGLASGLSVGSHSVAFTLRMDAMTVVIGLWFTAFMVLAGGLLPALSAMRVDPIRTMGR